MAKLTLLEMTQNILSAMDSDEVNSINDTVEAQQVAEIIKETYYDVFSNIAVPERMGLIKLQGLGDLTRPNYLQIPDDVISIDFIKYRNTRNSDTYQSLYYKDPQDFFQDAFRLTSNISDTTLVTHDTGMTFYIRNNQSPTYYTILEDKYVITDSYDSLYDSTLQASKTFVYGEREGAWQNEDDYIVPIDNDLFPLLLSEAKSVCFITLKQQANQKEESRSRRHRVHLQYRKWKDKSERAHKFMGPNYARTR